MLEDFLQRLKGKVVDLQEEVRDLKIQDIITVYTLDVLKKREKNTTRW